MDHRELAASTREVSAAAKAAETKSKKKGTQWVPFFHPLGGKNLALDTARESLDEFLLEDQIDDGDRDHRDNQH